MKCSAFIKLYLLIYFPSALLLIMTLQNVSKESRGLIPLFCSLFLALALIILFYLSGNIFNYVRKQVPSNPFSPIAVFAFLIGFSVVISGLLLPLLFEHLYPEKYKATLLGSYNIGLLATLAGFTIALGGNEDIGSKQEKKEYLKLLLEEYHLLLRPVLFLFAVFVFMSFWTISSWEKTIAAAIGNFVIGIPSVITFILIPMAKISGIRHKLINTNAKEKDQK